MFDQRENYFIYQNDLFFIVAYIKPFFFKKIIKIIKKQNAVFHDVTP